MKYIVEENESKRKFMTRYPRKINFEIIYLLIYSFATTFISEWIYRRSFDAAFRFMTQKTTAFLINYAIVIFIYSFAMLFRRKKFVYLLLTYFFLVLSILNSVVMLFRGMPFTPYDIYAAADGLSLAQKFMNMQTVILIIAGIAAMIISLIISFIRNSRHQKDRYISSFAFFIIYATIFLITIPQLSHLDEMKVHAWDIGGTYNKNGLVYSFFDECKSSIRKKPKNYSRKEMLKIKAEIEKKEKMDKRKLAKGKSRPNMIFVQLEAFMDPTRIKGFGFTEDPMPNMRKLMKEYTSGLMRAPTTGGGTARTEFEVLTGFDFQYLSHGEIPYHTFLSNKPCISIVSDLDTDGYYPLAIHNFKERFYNRNIGYKNLGFKRFIPVETMTEVVRNPKGYPKDGVLTKYIMNQIKKNPDQRNLIFTVSTQGHSSYPKADMDIDYKVRVTADRTISLEDRNQIEYYANQVKEMDEFVGELVKQLNNQKEPYVLCLYGDHLPRLSYIFENDVIPLYETLFAVVNNINVPKEKISSDFSAYNLSTLALKTASLPYGLMNKVQVYLSKDKDYREKFELVQYDILFGKQYILEGEKKPEPSNIIIGNSDLKISKIVCENGKYRIIGSGFNNYTKLFIDGVEKKRWIVNEKTIEILEPVKGKSNIVLKRFNDSGDLIDSAEKIYDFK